MSNVVIRMGICIIWVEMLLANGTKMISSIIEVRAREAEVVALEFKEETIHDHLYQKMNVRMIKPMFINLGILINLTTVLLEVLRGRAGIRSYQLAMNTNVPVSRICRRNLYPLSVGVGIAKICKIIN